MKKVNDFYNAKVEEISHTLSMLEDHVRSSHHLNASLIQTHDRNRLRKSRSNKSQSLMLNTDAEIGQEGEQLEASSENDGRKSQNDISREMESVKRAIIDLHRRSKLLENFAIMNTTAFVHIIKKFESILMEHQGRFSFVGNDDNICGGGVQASSLCEKMVREFNQYCRAWDIQSL
jgi:SPX domain protein involved in polyphosphate accumulation